MRALQAIPVEGMVPSARVRDHAVHAKRARKRAIERPGGSKPDADTLHELCFLLNARAMLWRQTP
jgi:hypothetical protein